MSIPKPFLITIFILVSLASQAQLLDNKLTISLGYSTGTFPGREIINQDDFTSPSLFANYSRLSGYSLKFMMDYKARLAYGLSFDYQLADAWESSDYLDFNGSSIQLISGSPMIRFQSRLRELGVFNRSRVFLELGPNVGISNLSLSKPVFDIRDTSEFYSGVRKPISLDIQDKPDFKTGPMDSRDLFWGMRARLGIDYSVNQRLGLYLNYSMDVNRVSSKLYSDQLFKRSCLNAGLLFKLWTDKYFYRTTDNY